MSNNPAEQKVDLNKLYEANMESNIGISCMFCDSFIPLERHSLPICEDCIKTLRNIIKKERSK